jgi:hypothetical protein
MADLKVTDYCAIGHAGQATISVHVNVLADESDGSVTE